MIKNYKFIFSGASITDSPWDTWADYTIKEFNIKKVHMNAYRGVGNEFISLSSISVAKKTKNPFVCAMFTNIDKWDWYIEDKNTATYINDNEKHIVRNIDGNIDYTGFWSTGSWFPNKKEYYKNNYYSQEYFTSETLKNIWSLQTYCKLNNIPCLILFDSPILELTEQKLNVLDLKKSKLTDNKLCRIWYDLIDWSNIYTPGLIGYCIENKLPWYDSVIKGHPPSESHKNFFNSIIKNQIELYA